MILKISCVCFRMSDKFDNELRQLGIQIIQVFLEKRLNSKTIIVAKHDQITEVQAYI